MKKAAIIVAALVIASCSWPSNGAPRNSVSVGTGHTSTTNAKVDPLIVNHFNLRGGVKPIPVVITYKSMPSIERP